MNFPGKKSILSKFTKNVNIKNLGTNGAVEEILSINSQALADSQNGTFTPTVKKDVLNLEKNIEKDNSIPIGSMWTVSDIKANSPTPSVATEHMPSSPQSTMSMNAELKDLTRPASPTVYSTPASLFATPVPDAIKDSPFYTGSKDPARASTLDRLTPDHTLAGQTPSLDSSLSPGRSLTSEVSSQADSHAGSLPASHSFTSGVSSPADTVTIQHNVDIKPTAGNTLPWNYAMDTLHTNISNPAVLHKLTNNSAGIKFNGNGLSGGQGAIDSVTINGRTYTDLGHINGAIKHVLDEKTSASPATQGFDARRQDIVSNEQNLAVAPGMDARHQDITTFEHNLGAAPGMDARHQDIMSFEENKKATDSSTSSAAVASTSSTFTPTPPTIGASNFPVGAASPVADTASSAGSSPSSTFTPTPVVGAGSYTVNSNSNNTAQVGYPPHQAYSVPSATSTPTTDSTVVAATTPAITTNPADSGWGQTTPTSMAGSSIAAATSPTQSSTAKAETKKTFGL